MRILLHVCCGPCAIMPMKILQESGFEISGFFHNPNIQPLGEYLRRREGAAQCASHYAVPLLFDDAAWDLAAWLREMLPFADSPDRCHRCIASRLAAAASKAASDGYEAYSTTLLYSRHQPHEFIREEGENLATQHGIGFIYEDFRKYWQEGINVSREWNLYRQAWCGCIFGEAERYAKKFRKVADTAHLSGIKDFQS